MLPLPLGGAISTLGGSLLLVAAVAPPSSRHLLPSHGGPPLPVDVAWIRTGLPRIRLPRLGSMPPELRAPPPRLDLSPPLPSPLLRPDLPSSPRSYASLLGSGALGLPCSVSTRIWCPGFPCSVSPPGFAAIASFASSLPRSPRSYASLPRSGTLGLPCSIFTRIRRPGFPCFVS